MDARAYDSIWLYAFGYFACYAPYAALTKGLSKGLLPGMSGAVSGMSLLPVSTAASLVGMALFLTTSGWWRDAGRRRVAGFDLPFPGPWTFLSGLCTAVIIGTTTLAYTFSGTSIVFMMLLMRGGVLVIAPVIDLITGRRVRWFSWVALALSLGALFTALSDGASYEMATLAVIDVAAYLAAYFIRLRFMSRSAKSDDARDSRRYFVEEQMVATPAVVLALGLTAALGSGAMVDELRAGYGALPGNPLVALIGVGLFSQGTGIFGGLILLDKRENTFCVPVNRCSSVVAGVVASYGLVLFFGQKPPASSELMGLALIVGAILFLTVAPTIGGRGAAPAARR